MIKPWRYLLRMVAFLVLVAAVCAVLGPGLVLAFLASPFLNGVILTVALLGILHIFRQVALLGGELRWERSRNDELFPHLYGELDLGAVLAVTNLNTRSDGGHDVPELLP